MGSRLLIRRARERGRRSWGMRDRNNVVGKGVGTRSEGRRGCDESGDADHFWHTYCYYGWCHDSL